MVIALAGKGGVGKSTLSTLIVRYLIRRGLKPVLAVDADPNNTLAEKLGTQVRRTVGDLREDALKGKHEAPAGTPKQRAIEYEVQQAIEEGEGYDLLVMGRGEGPGCYCSVNNMLRTFLEHVATGYKSIVVDNEAGMEHLSRRTNARVDLMLVVCDPTPTGMLTAQRIGTLANELGIVQGRMGLVINRTLEPYSPEKAQAATGLELFGCIPDDPQVREAELNSASLLKLPAESTAVSAIQAMLAGLGV
ncbi:MAG: ATP-binding protein [Armatimonadota bacterium]